MSGNSFLTCNRTPFVRKYLCNFYIRPLYYVNLAPTLLKMLVVIYNLYKLPWQWRHEDTETSVFTVYFCFFMFKQIIIDTKFIFLFFICWLYLEFRQKWAFASLTEKVFRKLVGPHATLFWQFVQCIVLRTNYFVNFCEHEYRKTDISGQLDNFKQWC